MKKEISLIKIFLIFLDFVLFFLSLSLVLLFRFGLDFYPKFQEHLIPFLFLFPVFILILLSFNFYDFYLLNLKNLFISLLNFFVVALIFSSLYFYFTQIVFKISPKTNLILFLVIFSFFVFLSRFLYIRFLRKNKIPVYFLGEKELEEKLKKDLENHPFFEFKNNQEAKILVISPNYHFDKKLFSKFLSSNLVIFDFIDFYEKFFTRIPLEAINFDWVVKKILFGESKIFYYFKRIIDIVLALTLFIFLFLPLFLPIAFLIYLNSPGPIFFLNERIGYRKKVFKLIKFRTMEGKMNEQKWAVGDEEKRIFFFGKILRKTHLDELPQIINILKGELSFVGPRPEQPQIANELEKQIPFYELRYLVLPGLTGWAQVNYKYPENIEETKIKLEYDLYYIKNESIFLDILIAIKTFQKLFF